MGRRNRGTKKQREAKIALSQQLFCKLIDTKPDSLFTKPSFESNFPKKIVGKNSLRSFQEAIQYKWGKEKVTYKVVNESDDFPDTSFPSKAASYAMQVWEIRTKNLRFERVYKGEDADIRISFSKTDKFFTDNQNVLAYAWYPNGSDLGGDIVFNDNKIWTPTGAPKPYIRPEDGVTVKLKTYALPHVMIHEDGHAIGLEHSLDCPECVMNPYYNGITKLNSNDIIRVQTIYGTRLVPSFWINHVEGSLYKRLISINV